MKIGILQTGEVNQALRGQFPEYPKMFDHLLNIKGSGKGDFHFETFRALDNHLPSTANECDGYIVTGSAAGVYEDHDWIPPLMDFICDCSAQFIPICGICFGHQIVAQALGGEVAKSPKGWVAGTHEMDIYKYMPNWMVEEEPLDCKKPMNGEDSDKKFSITYFHQDQVTKLPKDANMIASNRACEYGVYAIHDHIFCLQGHPEFSADYSKALLGLRRPSIGDEKTDRAFLSLNQKNDSGMVANWIRRFFINIKSAHTPAQNRSDQSDSKSQ